MKNLSHDQLRVLKVLIKAPATGIPLSLHCGGAVRGALARKGLATTVDLHRSQWVLTEAGRKVFGLGKGSRGFQIRSGTRNKRKP